MPSMYDVKKEDFKEDAELAKSAAQAINATWNEIGYDILSLDEGKAISRNEMLEVCLDANYMERHGTLEVCRYAIWMLWHNKAAFARFKKAYFPYAKYGY